MKKVALLMVLLFCASGTALAQSLTGPGFSLTLPEDFTVQALDGGTVDGSTLSGTLSTDEEGNSVAVSGELPTDSAGSSISVSGAVATDLMGNSVTVIWWEADGQPSLVEADDTAARAWMDDLALNGAYSGQIERYGSVPFAAYTYYDNERGTLRILTSVIDGCTVGIWFEDSLDPVSMMMNFTLSDE